MASPPNSNLSSEQLGAILGSVLGFTGLILLLCCCMAMGRRRRRTSTTHTRYVDVEVPYDTESELSFTETHRVRRYSTTRAARMAAGAARDDGSGQAWGWGSWMPRRTDTGFTTVPPPVRFPPTPRHTNYVQTPYPQIAGVRRYP